MTARRPGRGERRATAWRAGLLGLAAVATPVAAAPAQERSGAGAGPIRGFVEIVPTEGREPVELAAAQVVRVGRIEGYTVIDTAAWVQQRSVEPVEAVARRLQAAGVRLIGLTDLNGARTYLALDRVVLVRPTEQRHAAGARTSIVMVGLQMNRDVAVRESPEEVKATLRRALSADARDPSLEQPAAAAPSR